MFCGHCGQLNLETHKICVSCGTELMLSPALAAPAPVQNQVSPLNLTSYSGPKGVGGWLLFFCIGNTILAPIMMLSEAVKNSSDLPVVALDVGISTLAVSTGIALFIHSRFALALLKAYFLSMIVIAGLLLVGVPGGNVPNDSPTTASGRNVFQAARLLVLVCLWWMYFANSKRVLATYGRNL